MNKITKIIGTIISEGPIKVQFDPMVIKKLKTLLKNTSKMGQMEYSDFNWPDEIQKIIDEAEK